MEHLGLSEKRNGPPHTNREIAFIAEVNRRLSEPTLTPMETDALSLTLPTSPQKTEQKSTLFLNARFKH